MKRLIILISMILTVSLATPKESEVKESKSLDLIGWSQLQKQNDCIRKINAGIIKLKTNEEYLKEEDARIQKLALEKAWRGKLSGFLLAIGKKESGNNPNVWNKHGYLGKFQFGKAALITTGYGHITFSDFKEDPSIFGEAEQYDAMIKFTKINKRTLQKYIDKYVGTEIDGVIVTESGILGGAHIGGAGGVMKYLDSMGQNNPSDANNTSIGDYLKEFSGYKINLS